MTLKRAIIAAVTMLVALGTVSARGLTAQQRETAPQRTLSQSGPCTLDRSDFETIVKGRLTAAASAKGPVGLVGRISRDSDSPLRQPDKLDQAYARFKQDCADGEWFAGLRLGEWIGVTLWEFAELSPARVRANESCFTLAKELKVDASAYPNINDLMVILSATINDEITALKNSALKSSTDIERNRRHVDLMQNCRATR